MATLIFLRGLCGHVSVNILSQHKKASNHHANLPLETRHFDYYPSASEGDNQSVRSSASVVSRCFPGGYNVKLYISRGRLAWWLLAFLCCVYSFYHTRGHNLKHRQMNNFKSPSFDLHFVYISHLVYMLVI